MPTDSALLALGDEHFVSLTTFRRNGEAVSTPVWIAREGDSLVVTTPEQTGKVKRLRNNPQVELRPCDRAGKVKPGAVVETGAAVILDAPADVARISAIFATKYKLEYKIFMLIERVASRHGNKPRVMLRIT